MHKLGGKVIPNSNPPVRFKLNHNSTRLAPGEPDTSIWVGDLTPDVDDFALYQFFSQRYQTVRCAKVKNPFCSLSCFYESLLHIGLYFSRSSSTNPVSPRATVSFALDLNLSNSTH